MSSSIDVLTSLANWKCSQKVKGMVYVQPIFKHNEDFVTTVERGLLFHDQDENIIPTLYPQQHPKMMAKQTKLEM